MLGSEQLAQTVTNVQGEYTFLDVLPGVYNLAASRDGVTQTILAAITDSDVAGQIIAMPAEKLNSIVVGNLETAFTEEDISNSSTKVVELRLTAEAMAADSENADHREITETAESSVGLYLDMTQTKTVNGRDANITSSHVLLTSVISLPPAQLQGKDNYTVHRMHGGLPETLTATPNAEGEKIELNADRNILTVYVKTSPPTPPPPPQTAVEERDAIPSPLRTGSKTAP